MRRATWLGVPTQEYPERRFELLLGIQCCPKLKLLLKVTLSESRPITENQLDLFSLEDKIVAIFGTIFW